MKNNLICVSGLTPQIITESLFCLSIQKKTEIDELFIITTERGKEVILGRDESEYTPSIPLDDEINRMCEKYNIKKPVFPEDDKHIIVAREESIGLPDIRSDRDNILFPNRLCEFLREKSADPENVLYCSLSGGRKTMSAFLALALSIFGRENDRLFHVLTSEEHEFKGFFPETEDEINALELSEIPFVRLRPLIEETPGKKELLNKKYNELVKYTQDKLLNLSRRPLLLIDGENRSLHYGEKSIRLEMLPFALYYKFALQSLEGKGGLTINDITAPKFAREIKEIITGIGNYNYFDPQKKAWYNNGFEAENFRSNRSKINKKIEELFEDKEDSKNFIINVEKDYGNSRYYIEAGKDLMKIKM